jgi:Adenosine deaminase
MDRPLAVPWLEAAATAFPLLSVAAFDERTTELRYADGCFGVLDTRTARLAECFEREFRHQSGGVSIDVLRLWRDLAWFRGHPRSMPLDELLRQVAAEHLEPRGHATGLRRDGDPVTAPKGESFARRVLSWRWLSLRLPTDLLVAAVHVDAAFDPPRNHVDISTPGLRAVLERECAETHLHVGAAVSFPVLWAATLLELRTSPKIPDRLLRVESPPFGAAMVFWERLLAAAVARLAMARYLWDRERGLAPENFGAFVQAPPWRKTGDATRWIGLTSILDLLRGVSAVRTADVWRYYRALTATRRSSARRAPRREHAADAADECLARDPVAAWLPPRDNLAAPETRFATRALRYLQKRRDDRAFALVFWQYQRVREAMRTHVVEPLGIEGLEWFARHFDHIRPFRGPLQKAMYASALQLQSHETNLRAIEMRTAPDHTWSAVRDQVRALARDALRHQEKTGKVTEVGLILHFIKQREHRRGRQTRLHADPRSGGGGFRFAAWLAERWRETRAIERALENDARLLVLLRGIDVASRELEEPTWVLVPLYSRLREASVRAARWAGGPNVIVPPLRATAHVGEDYRRLTEGLRRVHEAMEYLLRTGDRMGHALAAGRDPEVWAAHCPQVPQPREDRLDDLLWELSLYARGNLPVDAQRTERVRREILEHGRQIYRGPQVTVDELQESRRLRHDRRLIDLLRQRSLPDVDRLLHGYWHDADVFVRGQEPVAIAVEASEVAFLKAAQRSLRKSLAEREITVESNPSSNLVIGGYRRFTEHPAFALNPVGDLADESCRVLVSINSDDPLTFATRLSSEIAYTYHALVASGHGAEEALHWVEKARSHATASRFTVEASTRRDVLEAIVAGKGRRGRRSSAAWR